MSARQHGKLKVASVGLGWVATHRHLPVMQKSGLYDVVGVVDRRDGIARGIAEKIGCRRYAQCDTLAAVDWLDEIDAVVIGASPHAHYALASEALDRGKHVLTEKPFVFTVAEGRLLVEKVSATGLTLGIVHNFQFTRSVQNLLSDIASGALGAITSVSATQLSNPRRRLPSWYQTLPLGLFYDESPHLLYLVHQAAPGRLDLIRADVVPAANGATPARIEARYRCVGDHGRIIPVSVNCNFESPVSEWHLAVFGENALAVVDLFRDIYIKVPNDGLHNTLSVLRTSAMASWQHWWQHVPSGLRHLRGNLFYGNEEVFRRFAAAVRGRTQPERMGPAEAQAVLEMQHAIVEHATPLY